MKREFSTAWKGSRQPRKQHKYRHNAPLHVRHSFLNAHLSKELRKKYGKRSLPLRKGDEVLVMRGGFAKKKAKIVSVSVKKGRVALEGIQNTRKDGTKVNVWFPAHRILIHSLTLDDKERIQTLERNKKESALKQSKGEK